MFHYYTQEASQFLPQKTVLTTRKIPFGTLIELRIEQIGNHMHTGSIQSVDVEVFKHQIVKLKPP